MPSLPSLRAPTLVDVPALRSLAIDTGMFSEDEAGFLDHYIAGFVDGTMEDQNRIPPSSGSSISAVRPFISHA